MPEEQKLELENSEFCRRQAIGTCDEFDFDPTLSYQNIAYYLEQVSARLESEEFEEFHRKQFEVIYANNTASRELFPVFFGCLAELNAFNIELSQTLQLRGEDYEYCELICAHVNESGIYGLFEEVYIDESHMIEYANPEDKELAILNATNDMMQLFENYVYDLVEKLYTTITVDLVLRDALRTQFAEIVESISEELKLPTLKDWEQGNL